LTAALRRVDDGREPLVGRPPEEVANEPGASAAHGDEIDVVLAQLVHNGIGRHLAVEVQPVGFEPGDTFPVLDELQCQLLCRVPLWIAVGCCTILVQRCGS